VSGYRSKLGPIPDEWFENDTGPDEKYKKTHPAGFLEGFLQPNSIPTLADLGVTKEVTARTTIPDGE
jgi:hypothetical protein